MTDEKLQQIQQLLQLVDERDVVKLEYNKVIAELLAPTMLSAVVELLDVPTSDMMWVDMDVIESVLTVVFTVTYDPATTKSKFLLRQNVESPGEGMTVTRRMRVGLPITMVFDDVETIKKFLLDVLSSDDQPAPTNPPDIEQVLPADPEIKDAKKFENEFDPKQLTREQVRQLLYFQHMTLGVKQ